MTLTRFQKANFRQHRHTDDDIRDSETGNPAISGGGGSWIGPFTADFATMVADVDGAGDKGWDFTSHFQEGDIVLRGMAISDEAFLPDDGGFHSIAVFVGTQDAIANGPCTQFVPPPTNGWADPHGNYVVNGELTPQIGLPGDGSFAGSQLGVIIGATTLVQLRLQENGDPASQGSMRFWFEVIR